MATLRAERPAGTRRGGRPDTASRAVTSRAVCSETTTTRSARRAWLAVKRWIVAPDFRGRPVGVIEEVEVVDGHDLERPPRRQQQRVRGVCDVDRSRQPFHRRPLQAMPGEVQHADRDPPVDDDGAGNEIGGRAVLPRAGEEDQAVAGGEGVRNRVGQLVHVLADAGALPERRAIIEQNPHARGIVACPIGVAACAATPCESTA